MNVGVWCLCKRRETFDLYAPLLLMPRTHSFSHSVVANLNLLPIVNNLLRHLELLPLLLLH